MRVRCEDTYRWEWGVRVRCEGTYRWEWRVRVRCEDTQVGVGCEGVGTRCDVIG